MAKTTQRLVERIRAEYPGNAGDTLVAHGEPHGVEVVRLADQAP